MLTYVTYREELPVEFCTGILSIAKELDTREADVRERGEDVKAAEVRNSRIAWLNNKDLIYALSTYAARANVEGDWNFSMEGAETPQISYYGVGQHYDWHVDAGVELEGELHRKLGVAISLNSDFKGGDFQIQNWVHPQASNKYTTLKEMRKAGSIAIFPSFIYHRVTKVKVGERASLVCWFRGQPFK